MNFIKQLFCKHNKKSFVRNIYGDEINYANGRSYWTCSSCEKLIVGKSLNPEADLDSDAMGRDIIAARRLTP